MKGIHGMTLQQRDGDRRLMMAVHHARAFAQHLNRADA